LQIIAALAGAATTGLGDTLKSLPGGDIIFKVVDSLQTTPVAILNGIRAIKSGDTFNGITTILGQVFTLGHNFTTTDCNCDGKVDETFLSKVFGFLGNVNSTAGTVYNNFIKDGSLTGWLTGIADIAGTWKGSVIDFLNSNFCPPEWVKNVVKNTLEVLSEAPKKISAGITAIKEHDWVNGVGDILEAALDSAQTFANGTKAEPIANALQNAGYTGVAIAQTIQGATQGLKGLQNGLQDAIDTLKEGWGDDWKDLKLKDRFEQIFKKLDLDPQDILSPKKAFAALQNWATTTVKPELKDIILDLLLTLTPWIQKSPTPQLVATP
jgi:hypothetical protein